MRSRRLVPRFEPIAAADKGGDWRRIKDNTTRETLRGLYATENAACVAAFRFNNRKPPQ